MNYNEAKTLLENKRGDKSVKKLTHNTYLHNRGTHYAIQLHQTDIIKFYPDHFELYTGGWHTTTTKDRINKYAPIRLFQEKSIWYFGNYIFVEGIKIDYTGKPIGTIQKKEIIETRIKKMKKRIKAYADAFILEDLKQMQPSSGDCWFCSMRTVGNMSIADASNNVDHLLLHIKEKYYVPTLLANAMLESGYREEQIGLFIHMDLKKQIHRTIVKYLQKRLITY